MITIESILAALGEQFGPGNVQLKGDGEIHVYSRMPNSNKSGWWLYGRIDSPETHMRLGLEPPPTRGGPREGAGRRSISGEAGESAVLRARTGRQRIDKLARIAAMRGTTPSELVRQWIDRMREEIKR